VVSQINLRTRIVEDIIKLTKHTNSRYVHDQCFEDGFRDNNDKKYNVHFFSNLIETK
jgi:hypothetical protein